MALELNKRVTALCAAALLLGGLAPMARGQNSPVGTWDVVLAHGQRGVAQISFFNDFTLAGFEILTVRMRSASGSGDIDPRTGIASQPAAGSSGTNISGASSLEGTWTYDSKGRVIGAITESAINATNSLSFRAVVRPGARITMTGSRYLTGHNVSYRGIPLAPLTDFSGPYYGTGRRNGSPVVETFTLSPWVFMNSYEVAGNGPGYTLIMTNSFMCVSGLKYAGFYSATSEKTNGLIRTVAGAFSLTKKRGSLTGKAENPTPGGTDQNMILKISPPGL